jgi:hypothetical protein
VARRRSPHLPRPARRRRPRAASAAYQELRTTWGRTEALVDMTQAPRRLRPASRTGQGRRFGDDPGRRGSSPHGCAGADLPGSPRAASSPPRSPGERSASPPERRPRPRSSTGPRCGSSSPAATTWHPRPAGNGGKPRQARRRRQAGCGQSRRRVTHDASGGASGSRRRGHAAPTRRARGSWSVVSAGAASLPHRRPGGACQPEPVAR